MQLSFSGHDFVFSCSFHDRHVAKGAGFTWDPHSYRWRTKSLLQARELDDYADASALKAFGDYDARVALGKAVAPTPGFTVPAPSGLSFRPYQLAGIEQMVARDGVLLADEMGLGKTIQIAGLVNADPSIESVIVVCPASLQRNWRDELQKWLVREVALTIVSYDTLRSKRAQFFTPDGATRYDLLVADEAHFVKNPKAARTKTLVGEYQRENLRTAGLVHFCRRKVFLTGTPVPARPIEAWPLLRAVQPTQWCDFWEFAHRYCNAHKGYHGWDFSGASRPKELNQRLLATTMVRRRKQDVLTDLPAKTRQVLRQPVPKQLTKSKDLEALGEAMAKIGISSLDQLRKELNQHLSFEVISRIRSATATAKIPWVGEHVADMLDDGVGKVVVFAHHRNVLDALKTKFGEEAVLLDGETSLAERDRAVKAFQSDPKIKVFIGSLLAAGTGLTLTASSHVVFAELDWTPGNVTQAEDRCHRIGQLNPVTVQYLLFDNTIDDLIASILVDKGETIAAVVDGETAANDNFVVERVRDSDPGRSCDPDDDWLDAA